MINDMLPFADSNAVRGRAQSHYPLSGQNTSKKKGLFTILKTPNDESNINSSAESHRSRKDSGRSAGGILGKNKESRTPYHHSSRIQSEDKRIQSESKSGLVTDDSLVNSVMAPAELPLAEKIAQFRQIVKEIFQRVKRMELDQFARQSYVPEDMAA